MDTILRESLDVGPLSIHRGYINDPATEKAFAIDIGFPFSDALVQLIPLTRGEGACLIRDVQSRGNGNTLEVRYDVSDPEQLVQIAYLVFVIRQEPTGNR